MEELAKNGAIIAAFLSAFVAACSLIVAVHQYRRTQRWLQLRFAVEEVEKIHSDEGLNLVEKFVNWHDRDIWLPKRYAHYGDERGVFKHRVKNMLDAMSVENRSHDPITGLYDLNPPFRTPDYLIYVEVFDQFFDYLSQLQIFKEARLLDDDQLRPIAYLVRRLDALHICDGYLEHYQFNDVQDVIKNFRAKDQLRWVRGTAGRDNRGA